MPPATPPTPAGPAPFDAFPAEAEECVPALFWLASVARLMAARSRSLSAVHKELAKAPDCPSYSTLRLLPKRLDRLLRRSFRRPVSVYRTRWPDGGPIVGLTEDGLTAAALAAEYLAGRGVTVG